VAKIGWRGILGGLLPASHARRRSLIRSDGFC
jgi:hypothetical protein